MTVVALAGPVGLEQRHLAQAHRGRRHLDTLVTAAELERLLQGQFPMGYQWNQQVARGLAHVGQLLLLRRVHVHVVGAGVLADDHALVDLDAGPDEHHSALLQVGQRETRRRPTSVGDERTGRAQPQIADPGCITLEDVVQQAGAARVGQEFGAEADQPSCRNDVLHPDPAGPVVDHLFQPAFAHRQHLDDRALVLRRRVNRQALHRLVHLAVHQLGDHLRLAHRQLEALTAHDLHQDRKLQLAAALHLPGVGPLRVENADGDVADQLTVQAVLDLARGQFLAALPRQRRGVDADGHGDRRLVDGDNRQRAGVVRVGQGLTDRDLRDAGDRDDVARAGRLGRLPGQRLRQQQLGDLDPLDRAVGPAPRRLLALANRAVVHAAQRQPAQVRRAVQVRDVRLQRSAGDEERRRNGLHDRVEQRFEVLLLRHGAVLGPLQRRPPGLARGVHDRELDLVLVGVEVQEELVRLVHDLGDAGVRSVDLVDDQNDRQLQRQRLAQHETGLRQRSLTGVDEEQDSVHHRQASLDLAAEVGVPRRVDDVDGDELARRPLVLHRGVLGENGDALLALQVHRVHDPDVHLAGVGLVRGERAGLPQHRVDEGRLAVVHVRHDGHVAQVVSSCHFVCPCRLEGRAGELVRKVRTAASACVAAGRTALGGLGRAGSASADAAAAGAVRRDRRMPGAGGRPAGARGARRRR